MDRKEKLLRYIRNMNMKDALAEFTAERDTYKKYRGEAFRRMEKQRREGQFESAANSEKAYSFCKEYVEHLNRIIEGYKKKLEGKCYFTKDGDPAGRFKRYQKQS